MEELWRLAKSAITDALGVRYHGAIMNERYLHHFISHRLQAGQAMLDLTGETSALHLHPEWPTSKQSTKLPFGRYRRRQGQYMPTVDGSAGFIDFTMGNYGKPDFAIELTLKCNGWSHEEVVYDLVKLLDGQNPFSKVICFNVILRPERISSGGRRDYLKRRMLDAYEEALSRLAEGVCETARERIIVVSEIGPTDRRHWYFDVTQQDFLETAGTPPLLVLGDTP